MNTAFVAVAAAAIRCHQYVKYRAEDKINAFAAWEGMLNSLATSAWLKAILAAGLGAPFAERTKGMKMALRSTVDIT